MLKPVFAPSIISADVFQMDRIIRAFEKAGIPRLHMDVMDGHFVPNYALGTGLIEMMRAHTSIPLDIHLMVERPDLQLDRFDIRPGEIVTVHAESTPHLMRTLQMIREKGALAFAAINPGTPVSVLENVTDCLDGVLCMTVNPGFTGQTLVPGAMRKIRTVREFLDKCGLEHAHVEVDGHVSFENAREMADAGADLLVGGTGSIFRAGGDVEENIRRSLKALEGRA